jgi:hypothetical protein
MPFDGSCLDESEEDPPLDATKDEPEEAHLFDGSSDDSAGRLFITFGESDRSIAGLLTDDNVSSSIADLLTLPMDKEISQVYDSHSETSIQANISSWLIDDEHT